MNKWYSGEGKNSDVVVGATVRLARNLADAPFPIRMNNEIRRNTVKKIFAAVKNSPYAGEFDLVDLSAVSSAQAYAYAEQQLISRRFARQKDQSAFLLSKDGSASVMLCEEDHIRLQVRAAGQDLEGAYAKADKLDDALLERLPIAFDERLGFLTAVPTNLGTGMQAMLTKQADGLREIVQAAGGDPDAALRLLLADKMEELLRVQVEAVKNIKIDKVTVWDSGENGQGKTATAGFVSGLMKSLPPMNELFDMAGMNLPSFLGSDKKEEAESAVPAASPKKEQPEVTEEK